MIKAIKVKKQMRLDDLIKYIFDNWIEDKVFPSNGGSSFDMCEVRVSGSGNIKMSGYINEHTTFTVEVEEEIDEDTFFEDITVVFENKSAYVTSHFYDSNLKKIKKAENLLSAYIPINGKLQLIYERNEAE